MKKGLLIVVSGPSGVGKSTVREEYMKDESLNLSYSISMTTRAIREGEEDGVDYFFVTKRKFTNAVKRGELLEHATFVGNYYGTPKFYVEKLRNEGRNVILEIEIDGAMQVMEKEPDVVSIFILPPSFEDLENRIRGRNSDSEEIIQGRLEKARIEVGYADRYKYNVVNRDIKECAAEIAAIIHKEMEKEENNCHVAAA